MLRYLDVAMENKLATVDLICVDWSHIERGRDVPDGYGALKLRRGRAHVACAQLSATGSAS